MKRYVVLDSWRGICACLLVLYHFTVYSHFYTIPLIRGGYLFVDFFFVLSGFVITGNYRERLLEGFPVGKFMWLRLGRLYPLHMFILLLIILHVELKNSLASVNATEMDGRFSIASLIANLFLLQGMGIFKTLTWNASSWSISVEFYTYLVFAWATLGVRRAIWMMELAIMLLAPAFLASTNYPNMDINYDYGIIRCIYGFCAGGICYRIHKLYLENRTDSAITMNILELAVIMAFVAFVSCAHDGKLSILSPYVFSLVVLTFAQEKGWISKILLRKECVLIGALSYSIYMVHGFLLICIYNLATMLEHKFKIDIYTYVTWDGVLNKCLGTRQWQGDMMYPLFLILVIAVSYLTHRYIEMPANNWFRNIKRRKSSVSLENMVKHHY